LLVTHALNCMQFLASIQGFSSKLYAHWDLEISRAAARRLALAGRDC
jgi:hypothetical protein